MTVRFIIGICALCTTGCAFSSPRYQGPKSDHFDGTDFTNKKPIRRPGFRDVMQLMTAEKKGRWKEWVENDPEPPPPERVSQGSLRITFINHATTLIQMDGLNILTDPIWSERASPVSFAGPKRHRAAGVAMDDLPPLDAVIISHNHYDHMDLPSLAALAERNPGLRIFVGLGNDLLLAEAGISGAVPIDWEQSVPLSDEVTLVGQPNQHFSGRGLSDGDGSLWLAYVILGPSGPVYFAGDTGFGPHFEQTGKTYGPFRLAILPIGAYLPRWFMAPIHIDPAEAVEAARLLRAETSVGIHFGTFDLAADGQDQPVKDLFAALKWADPRPRFWVLPFGAGRDVPPIRPRQQ